MGRKARVVSPFMPRFKGTKEETPTLTPQALKEETAPVKKKVMSPGAAGDVTATSTTGTLGKGTGIAKDMVTGFASSTLGRVGMTLGPLGALAGTLAPMVARGLSFGKTMGEDVSPNDAMSIGMQPATQADIDMRSMGAKTYDKEIRGGISGITGEASGSISGGESSSFSGGSVDVAF